MRAAFLTESAGAPPAFACLAASGGAAAVRNIKGGPPGAAPGLRSAGTRSAPAGGVTLPAVPDHPRTAAGRGEPRPQHIGAPLLSPRCGMAPDCGAAAVGASTVRGFSRPRRAIFCSGGVVLK